MTEDNLTKTQAAVLVMAFAPILTMLGFPELGDAFRDPKLRPWVYIAAAGDLLYFGLGGAAILYGRAIIPYMELVAGTIASLDPHLVWQPWQPVAGSIVVGAVLLIMGYRGFEWAPKGDSE